jgi:quinol-cytochrome oxidoreductase complex cytochrome b subunit
MNKVYDWFEERLEVQAIADDISSKYVPPHVNFFTVWWPCFHMLLNTSCNRFCNDFSITDQV